MILKPQDALFLLKLLAQGRSAWSSYGALALELSMSPSEVHAAANRVVQAQLGVQEGPAVSVQVRNFGEFLIHGIRYCFVPERGELTRGMPTAHAAAPLSAEMLPTGEPPPVWPDPEGSVRGESFTPLYRSAPAAAKRDSGLYELLALVDALRGGRARERSLAATLLRARLNAYA
jgi:hypothetical protein